MAMKHTIVVLETHVGFPNAFELPYDEPKTYQWPGALDFT